MIRQTIETITPAIATEYLNHNTKNRNIRPGHVSRLASDIRSGRWLFDGQPIRFDIAGNLIDGQHRLNAVVRAGLPIEAVVVRGLAPEAMLTIDTNKSRKPADAAKIYGFKNSNVLCATVRILISYKTGSASVIEAPVNETIDFIDAHPDLPEIVNACSGLRRVIHTSAGPAWYYLATKADPLRAIDALDTLLSGVPKYPNDPIHAFRERMITLNADDRSHKNKQMRTLWTLVGAWNHYVKGRTLMKCPIRNEHEAMTGLDISKL